MKRFNRLFQKQVIITLSIMFACSSYVLAEQAWQEEGADLVARITVIEGRLERFDSETDAWMIMVPDMPVGIDEQIFASVDTRVEILIPNNTILRIGEETEVRFVSLTEKITEVDLFSGTARLSNNSFQTDIIVATPFGRIQVPPKASVDLYIDGKAVEIISLNDSVFFISGASSAIRHEVIAGSASLLVYSDRIIPSGGSVDRSWDRWSQDRDILWAERRRFSGESQDYLPTPLHDETYVLDTCGSWQRVYYQGEYYRFWRPRNVGYGWAPFTMGRWMNWRGDRVWIPQEPFGYVTHHYGNWIYTLNNWYWAPPVSLAMVRPGLPLMKIGFGWYPGRVAWIDTGIQMSWIPLAPFEPFYCHYSWGIRTIVIAKGSHHRHIAKHKFKYRRQTIRGRRDHFYRDKRGSHVSKWRTARRSGVHSSLMSRNRSQHETGSLRNKKEKNNGDRIRKNETWERNQTRVRQKRSEARIKKDREGKVAEQGRNSIGSSLKTEKRKSSARTNNSAVSTPPVKSRQFKDQPAERRGNQLKKQNQPPRSTGNIQQSGSQKRSGLARANKNAFLKNPPDRVKGLIKKKYKSEIKKGNRKSTVGPNSSAVSTPPVKSRQFKDQPAERRGNQLKKQNQSPRPTDNTGNVRQSGSQNRTGVARTSKNTARMENNTRRNR